MVGDLTQFLYTNNMLRYIEGYVQKVRLPLQRLLAKIACYGQVDMSFHESYMKCL